MNLAPIILFVYNRPEHTLKTITALQNNVLANQSELYIFSDGPKTAEDQAAVNNVRAIIHEPLAFKKTSLFLADKNKGLANSVIDGVTKIISSNYKVIVIEDDIITTPTFLTFCNNSLNYYEDKKEIFSISGYSFPIEIPKTYTKDIYVTQRASSWGWCTWKDRWHKNDWEVIDFNHFIHDPKAKRHPAKNS